jgi:Flp pilus assembly secretin CpaC
MPIRFASSLKISFLLPVLVLTSIRSIAEESDKPTVRVELRLIELRYDKEDELGVRMNVQNIFAIEESNLREEGPFKFSDSVPARSGFHCVLSREDLNRSLTALSQFTDLRILTEPQQTLESGEKGDFEILVYTGNVPGGDSRAYTTEEYRARYPQQLKGRAEIGPHFGSGAEVTLSLDCELLAEPSLFESSSDVSPQDATPTFRVSGEIAMKRGETLVLGGFVHEGVEGEKAPVWPKIERDPRGRHSLLAVSVHEH